jgi:Mn2+/Fe2+ NRAMP family transporter
VLAGSAAYAIGEALRWRVGLSRGPLEAKAFYGTLAAATATGAAFNLAGVDPIRALFWSAVVNGVAAAPLLALAVLVASRRDVMSGFAIGPALRAAGWATVALLAASAAAMAVLALRGGDAP